MPNLACNELHWLLTSPGIFADLPGIRLMPPSVRARLASALGDWLSGYGDATNSHVGHPGEVVGHRAERLLAEALRHCPGIDLIHARLAIRVGTTTCGEFDLLYDDHQRASRVHCELSVRILLQRTPHAEWSAWCGTDPRQTLDDKLVRLRDHQLPLGHHPAVPRHATWPTVSEALLLGWLLQPVGQEWPLVSGAAPDHLRGWWLRHGEHEPPQRSRASRFTIIPADGWMTWGTLPGESPVLSARELSTHLRQHFARATTVVLVAEVIRDEEGGWREIGRGAVVHPRWPLPIR